jgi:hypothetical protein
MKLIYKIESILDKIKYAFQRAFRGYDDPTRWGLCDAVEKISIPVLKEYLKEAEDGCHPGSLTKKQWINILKTIIEGFQSDEDACDYLGNKKDIKKFHQILEKKKKAAELFGKVFYSLWN